MQAFAEKMWDGLAKEQPTHDASMEKAVPGIQQFPHAHQQDLEKMGRSLANLSSSVDSGFKTMKEDRKKEALAQDCRLAVSFLDDASSWPCNEPVQPVGSIETAVPLQVVKIGVPLDLPGLCPHTPSPTALVPRQHSPMDRGGSPDFSSWRLCPKHTTVTGMADEWHGRGKFQAEGISGRNEQCSDQ